MKKSRKAVSVQTGTKLVFHVEAPQELAAGLYGFSEMVEINFKFSQHMDPEGVEFFEGMLKEYYDGAAVFLHKDDGTCPRCDEGEDS